MSEKLLVIIPARGGSKGLPRKNLALLGGRPLVAWSIDVGLRTPSVGRVVVSTDDDEVAAVSLAAGADVPFRRPAELASDNATSAAVVLHALTALGENGTGRVERIVLLQPTSPLRDVSDVEGAIRLSLARDADAVVSVSEAECHPWYAVSLDHEGRLHDMIEHPRFDRRQDLTPAYRVNGAVYVVRRTTLEAQQTLIPAGALAWVMPPERSVDIDRHVDLIVAEALLREGPR
ncbi:MAG TPA: acylneuraminate cytidylyltransferase family protein [Solirubrobacteraceae bacterium]